MNITGRFKEIHTIFLFANSIISAISSGVEKAGFFQQLHFAKIACFALFKM